MCSSARIGPAGGHAPDQREPELLAQRVLETDAARGSGHKFHAALARQGPQVLLGGVGRAEPELCGDLGAGGRHAGLDEGLSDQMQDLGLSGREV